MPGTTDTRKAQIPTGSFIMNYQSSRMYPQLESLAKKYSADKKDMANSQNVILTNGEIYFPPDAVEAIGVEKLEYMNNKSKGGAHDAIDNAMAMSLLKNIKPMYGGGMVKPSMKPMAGGGMMESYRGGGMVMDQYGHGGMVKNKMMNYGHGGMVKDKMMMMEKGGQLKPVPEDNPGLGKLPEMVRNRMGYMQEGGEVIDYLDTAGLYNRFLIENNKEPLSNRDLLVYKSLQNPNLKRKEYLNLFDSRSDAGARFAKDASLTSALLNEKAMEGITESDSLKIIKALSPEGKRMYESYFLEGGMQDGGMVDNSLMGMMGGGMAMKKKKMMSYQDGGAVMLPPQPKDPLQIGARQADPSMYEGSQLGVRDQAMMLQDSIEQDTVNKARKTLQLMKLKGLLEGAESLDYQEPEMKQGADEEMTRQMLQRMIMMRGMPF